jgi:hypothetical protein
MISGVQLPLAISVVGAAVAAISLLVAAFSAFTAFRGLRHTRRTSYTQLRPWVCYAETGIDLFTDPSGHQHLAFHIRWKNAGSTPALVSEVIALGMACATPEQARAHTFESVEVDSDLNGIVGPGVTVNSPTCLFKIESFRSGSTVLYSKVMYRDILSRQTHESEVKLIVSSQHKSSSETTFFYQVIAATAT